MRAPAKRILITAASSTFGRALIDELLQDRAVEQVLAVHAPEQGVTTPWSELWSERWSDPRVVPCSADLQHARERTRLVQGKAAALGIDAVVHDLAYPRQSADAARQLLQLCEAQKSIQRVVFRSTTEVYRLDSRQPAILDEDHALAVGADAPSRELVESDLHACSHMLHSRLQIHVLRCAPLLALEAGDALFDYLCAPICLRALGYDPMLNVLHPADAAHAVVLSLGAQHGGVFNVPGKDVLPLSELIHLAGRPSLPLPGNLLAPLYRFRARTTGAAFEYAAQRARLHCSGIVSGKLARESLGYAPTHGIDFVALARDVAAHVAHVHRLGRRGT